MPQFAALLSLAATAVALLQASERVAPRFASVLQRVSRFGLTTARLETLVLFLWLVLWLLLVIFIVGVRHASVPTLSCELLRGWKGIIGIWGGWR